MSTSASVKGELAAPLVGTNEIAEAVGVHPQTIRDLARKGIIPVIRVSRKLSRYDVEAVLDALRGRAATPPGASPASNIRA